MREAFGYLATMITVRQILEGTYVYPSDFDKATKQLCLPCAKIRLGIPANSVDAMVQGSEWSSR